MHLLFGNLASCMDVQFAEGVDDVELGRLSYKALSQLFDLHLLLRDHSEQVLNRSVRASLHASLLGLGRLVELGPTACVHLNIGLVTSLNRLVLVWLARRPPMHSVLPALIELSVLAAHRVLQDRRL